MFNTDTYHEIYTSTQDAPKPTQEICSQRAFQDSGESDCQTPKRMRKTLKYTNDKNTGLHNMQNK